MKLEHGSLWNCRRFKRWPGFSQLGEFSGEGALVPKLKLGERLLMTFISSELDNEESDEECGCCCGDGSRGSVSKKWAAKLQGPLFWRKRP